MDDSLTFLKDTYNSKERYTCTLFIDHSEINFLQVWKMCMNPSIEKTHKNYSINTLGNLYIQPECS